MATIFVSYAQQDLPCAERIRRDQRPYHLAGTGLSRPYRQRLSPDDRQRYPGQRRHHPRMEQEHRPIRMSGAAHPFCSTPEESAPGG